MRLINGGKLEEVFSGPFCQTYKDCRMALWNAPIIDAIPVEWLRDMMLKREAEESRAAWVVMREWRKWKQEQEAHQ